MIKIVNNENLTINTAAEALNYATPSLASHNGNLALLIKLPKLDHRQFRKLRIFPIQNHQVLHLDRELYLHHPSETRQIRSLDQTIFSPEESVVDESTCIPELLRGRPAKCNLTGNPLSERIVRIDNKHILINSGTNVSFASDCGTTERKISGSFLITFENCGVIVNHVTYLYKPHILAGEQLTIPLDGIKIAIENTVDDLSLRHLQQMHLESRKEIESLKLQSDSIT